MKARILTGWTLKRALYAGLGVYLIIQSVATQQWFGVIFGTYFTSMGIFSFGCAAGNCYVEPTQNNKTDIQEIAFEEIKQK